jgi:molybdopterin molybdotransferase
MDFFNVVTVNEARNIIMENFSDYGFDIELIDLLDSTDRVLAFDIYSEIDVPEFDRSTVDGYGIIVEDSHGATEAIPSILNMLGEVRMGEYTKFEIKSGDSVYIPTGGMLPKGTTGVIMIENTELMDKDTLLIYKPISKGENIVFKGDDTKKGDIALKKGRHITPEVIGVLASLGISQVKVYKKPSFYIISTGDEVIDLDAELTMGKVRDINTYALYSLIQKLGCEVVGQKIVSDNYELLREEVEKGTALADIVLLSGGSSVGTRDFTDKVIGSFEGRGVLVHGLAIKPGKPTIIGEGNGKLIIGLPGHPVSSIVVFKAIVEDYINKKLGNDIIPSQVRAIMDYNFPSSPGKETYHMVTLRTEGDRYYASPTFGKSGMITLLSKSQGYIVISDYEEGINRGEERTVYLL